MKERLRLLAPLLPLAAVGIGMYWLGNAWFTLLLYHLGMVACLVGAGRRDLLGLIRRRDLNDVLSRRTLAAMVAGFFSPPLSARRRPRFSSPRMPRSGARAART